VRQHLDACLVGALEDRLEGGRVVRDDRDHVDLAGDQVLDRAHLLRRVGLGRPDHPGVDALLLAGLLDPGLHGVEPGNAADLHDDRDLGLLGLGECLARRTRQHARGRHAAHEGQRRTSGDHRL
jgi:hypothetical protein